MVVAIIVVALIAVVGVMYYRNIFQLKSMVVGFFISQDAQYAEAIAAGEEYKVKMEELNQRQLELADKEKQLADKEADLLAAEEAAQSEQGDMSTSGTVGGEAGQQQVVQMYESMSVENAATILNQTADNGWIANLLMQMEDQRKASRILAALDVDKAIAITQLMSE
ncbi:MAG TPA: hypothetical protein DEB31_05920 [Clostridiales bacterium]|nr:hypothetical protein [Clostridiales bacterium]